MLTEKDYCDYETCVALKEEGFREKCVAYYDADDNVGLLYNTVWYEPSQVFDMSMSHNTENYEGENFIDAPTLYEAQKWLREEKKIEIVVLGQDYIGGPYYPDIYTEDGPMNKAKGYKTYEEALSEGIKEAIKILKEWLG